MATSATLRQTRTVENGKFKLVSLVTDSSGFREDILGPPLSSTRSLFLIKFDGTTYQHVARVGDVENYEDGPNEDLYYRLASVMLEFDTVEEAQAESDAQKLGMANLVTDYDVFKNTYVTEPPTYPSGYEENTYSS
jgi:hypothetical protein